jgi:NAD+ kinase
MSSLNSPSCDVVVIQKQTTLERYNKQDFIDYISKDSQNLQSLNYAHQTHVRNREVLLHALKKRGLSFDIYNLDELQQHKIKFFSTSVPESLGVRPKRKLVIALGGDGTLLHASHIVGGDTLLMGINSCPEHSVGHLCPIKPHYTEQALDAFLEGRITHSLVQRIKVTSLNNQKQILPLALNDILICHKHPAATSRYEMSLFNKGYNSSLNSSSSLDSNPSLDPNPSLGSSPSPSSNPCFSHTQSALNAVWSEKQLSSGVWISTALGSTAAIAAYGYPPQPETSKDILVAVRELYAALGQSVQRQKFSFDGDLQELHLFCRMRQGLVCVDGPDSSAWLSFGEGVSLTSGAEHELRIVLNFTLS